MTALKLAETAMWPGSGDGGSDSKVNNTDINRNAMQADETSVVERYGTQLKEVAKQRDTYITTACAMCEQLKPNLKPLKSLERRKGFDCDKMTEAIDMLYQNKTRHEDIDDFKMNISICSYCADKLLSNKDVARSFLNKLSVVPTPQPIKILNIYERCLIKFCMTCLTIVRLGQITNKSRAHNELTAALKGRIAYIPVDVEANAKFVPEDLLNIDSLCVIVAGQPTKAQKNLDVSCRLKKSPCSITLAKGK